jgi:sRNA-binding regulator protein Hfq
MSITDLNMERLIVVIQELSKQIETSRELNQKETEKLTEYQNAGTMLEFTLITGGIIKGKISWLGNQSIGINTDNSQSVILYKHAIAFIQEKTA